MSEPFDFDELAAAGDDARKRKREDAMFPPRTESKTLAEIFSEQQARLRGLIDAYRDIGPAGAIGLAMIRQTLARADAVGVIHGIARGKSWRHVQ